MYLNLSKCYFVEEMLQKFHGCNVSVKIVYSLFDEFLCKLGFFDTNELNTTFFCSTSP
jgi:hypothetical protein